MKLFGKLMLAALVIALLLPFTILKDDNGSTLMSFSDFKLPDFSMPSLPSSNSIKSSTGGQVVFYKWYDADGNVEFTTEPPPDGIEYSSKGYDPNTNVIQAVKLPEEPEAGVKISIQKKTEGAADTSSPYSKESIEKIFEADNNIEQLLNQRIQNQESAINQ